MKFREKVYGTLCSFQHRFPIVFVMICSEVIHRYVAKSSKNVISLSFFQLQFLREGKTPNLGCAFLNLAPNMWQSLVEFCSISSQSSS